MLPILSTKYSHYCFWGSCVTDKSGGWGDAVLPGPYKKGMSEVGRMVTRKSAPSIYKSQHPWLHNMKYEVHTISLPYIDPLTIQSQLTTLFTSYHNNFIYFWPTDYMSHTTPALDVPRHYTTITLKQTNTHINKEQIELRGTTKLFTHL